MKYVYVNEGDLKMEIAKATGLEPEAQNLLFRGKEKDENERLDMAGVKDNAKVILTENSPTKDKDKDEEEHEEKEEENVEKVEEEVKEISKGVEAVSLVRKENDEFAEQVTMRMMWRAFLSFEHMRGDPKL